MAYLEVVLYTRKRATIIERIINTNINKRVLVKDIGEMYKILYIPEEISLYSVYEALHINGVVGEFTNIYIERSNTGKATSCALCETHITRIKTNVRYSINDIEHASYMSSGNINVVNL